MKAPRLPRANSSPREYAKWLHEDAGLPYSEACNMAGYDPTENGQMIVIAVLVVSFVLGLAALAWQVLL
jgi:hypothetical protein